MTKFDTQIQFNSALIQFEKNFNDEMDGDAYITAAALVQARNAKLLANYLGGQETMPRDHIFKIIEENVPNFFDEVADIYEEL